MAYKPKEIEEALQLLNDYTYEQVSSMKVISVSTLVRAVRKKRFEIARQERLTRLQEEIDKKLEEAKVIQEQLLRLDTKCRSKN